MQLEKQQTRYRDLAEAVILEADELNRRAMVREMDEIQEKLLMEASMGNAHSGKKVARKAKRIFDRTVRKEANKVKMTMGDLLKPKPKYVPWPVWLWGVRLFIKVSK